jgi:hypothetical protein
LDYHKDSYRETIPSIVKWSINRNLQIQTDYFSEKSRGKYNVIAKGFDAAVSDVFTFPTDIESYVLTGEIGETINFLESCSPEVGQEVMKFMNKFCTNYDFRKEMKNIMKRFAGWDQIQELAAKRAGFSQDSKWDIKFAQTPSLVNFIPQKSAERE